MVGGTTTGAGSALAPLPATTVGRLGGRRHDLHGRCGRRAGTKPDPAETGKNGGDSSAILLEERTPLGRHASGRLDVVLEELCDVRGVDAGQLRGSHRLRDTDPRRRA